MPDMPDLPELAETLGAYRVEVGHVLGMVGMAAQALIP